MDHGARSVLIRPAAPPGLRGPRSFALPEFDPFWKRVVELDVLVAMHASDSGYTRFTNEWEGASGEMMAFNQSLFQISVMHNRAIEDAVTSWVAHGALTRHPKLRVAIVENGSSWVRPLLAHLETCCERMPQAWEEHPVDAIRRNIWIHPFHEDGPIGLIGVVGADNVVFGSDYPHVEGMADPISFVDQLYGLPDNQRTGVAEAAERSWTSCTGCPTTSAQGLPKQRSVRGPDVRAARQPAHRGWAATWPTS